MLRKILFTWLINVSHTVRGTIFYLANYLILWSNYCLHGFLMCSLMWRELLFAWLIIVFPNVAGAIVYLAYYCVPYCGGSSPPPPLLTQPKRQILHRFWFIFKNSYGPWWDLRIVTKQVVRGTIDLEKRTIIKDPDVIAFWHKHLWVSE